MKVVSCPILIFSRPFGSSRNQHAFQRCGPFTASVNKLVTFQTTWQPFFAPWLPSYERISYGNGLNNTKRTFRLPGPPYLRRPFPNWRFTTRLMPAAAWAMRKCRQFLEGLPSFNLFTDHRPLIPILNDYFLDKLDNPRILCLRLSMPRYSFVASWVPGRNNVMADALSRFPVDLLFFSNT